MGIDIGKLENVTRIATKTIARCPACAEKGQDNKGEHLFIDTSGRFGCVVHPGTEGNNHRKRVFELVGREDAQVRPFHIYRPVVSFTQPTINNILGRLGRGI